MKSEEKYADRELIAWIQDRTQLNVAIRFIYQQYSEPVSSFIMSRGGSQHDAEDIFQETVVAFIEVVKNGKFREEASLKTFLIAIAKNIWYNALNKRKRSQEREKVFELDRATEELDIGHAIGDREMKQKLRNLLDLLGEPCKKLLILFYYDNLSMKEMLDHLPYENEQVIRNKKYKCLQQLIGIMKENPAIVAQIKDTIR
ncbi:MAG: RNA polymerase sigma factor [Chitinophagales bacterium]